jgi:hypothetical protein
MSLVSCLFAYTVCAHFTLRVNDIDATNWSAWWFVGTARSS